MKHNLSVGARFGRSPDLGYGDIGWLCKSAILSEGVVRSFPQQEFAIKVLSNPSSKTTHRNATAVDYDFVTWGSLFPGIEFDASSMKQQLGAQCRHRANIRDLLLSQGPVIQDARIRRLEFLRSMNLTPSDVESAREFSPTEFELLRKIRKTQLSVGDGTLWRDCVVVNTIHFNAVVTRADDERAKLYRRSFNTVSSKLAWIKSSARAKNIPSEDNRPLNTDTPLFSFTTRPVCDLPLTPSEKRFAEEQFTAVRKPGWQKKRAKFCSLMDFAGHVCTDISRKSEETLQKLWGSIKRAVNRADTSSLVVKFSGVRAALDSCENSRSQNDVLGCPSPLDTFFGTETQLLCVDSPQPDTFRIDNNAEISTVPASVDERSKPQVSRTDLESTLTGVHNFAATLPQETINLWQIIYSKYVELAPDVKLDLNALRCRIRRKIIAQANASKAITSDSPATILGDSSTFRKSQTLKACAVCHKRKRKCGDHNYNRKCLRLQATDSDSIAQYILHQ